MRLLTFVSAAAALRQALAAPSPEQYNNPLDKRAVPAACAKPVALALAYDVLSALNAQQFCTSWLGITTKIVGGRNQMWLSSRP
jgi:hypothetical protein